MLLGTYEFYCTLTSPAILPAYKGSTFRGAFGASLKRAVCAIKNQECNNCLLSVRCIYAQTFEHSRNDGAMSQQKATPPVPYLIEPPLDTQTRYSSGSPFNFSLLLFGAANDSLPYFVYAFELMGEFGIGARVDGKRGCYLLNEVRSNGKVIYDSVSRKLNAISPLQLVAPTNDIVLSESTIKLKMLTPLRLKHQNELSGELPFNLLVRAMLRRVSSLFEHFGSGEPALDYKKLVADAQNVQMVASALRWHDWERYSGRQEKTMLMGGLIGTITYKGLLTPYLPLLELCQKLHIGKQSSFGLGSFDFEISTGDAA